MALVRATLPHPNNMQSPPGQPASNHYLNHDALADKMAQHGATMGQQPAQGDCMCCGRRPNSTLWHVEVQSQPDQEWVQIGIPRCKEILVAALLVRMMATVNPLFVHRLAVLVQALGETPPRHEILLMGGLLRPCLTNPYEVSRLDAYLATV